HDPFEDRTPAVTVHRLVQAVARARSETTGLAECAIAQLVERLMAIYPGANRDPHSWPLCAQLTPHLLARRDACFGGTVFAGWPALLNSAGSYFLRRAAYSQAAPLFREALAISEKTLGPEHCETARGLSWLAILLQAEGDFAGARPLYERAL